MCKSSANCSAVNNPLCRVLMILYVNFLPLDTVVNVTGIYFEVLMYAVYQMSCSLYVGVECFKYTIGRCESVSA